LSGRGLCDELITRPEESYRLWCVVVYDLETSRIGAPYIYDIKNLRVKNEWSYTSTPPIFFPPMIWTSKTSPSHLVYRDLQLQSDDSWCNLHPVRDRRHRSKFATLPTAIWDLKYVLRLVFVLYISSRPHMCYFVVKHCLGSVIWLLEFAETEQPTYRLYRPYLPQPPLPPPASHWWFAPRGH